METGAFEDPPAGIAYGVLVFDEKDGFACGARRRLFALRGVGPRPLVEDDSVRSKATSLANLEAGYKFSKKLKLAVDVFNLFNARGSDIDYYYASRLPGEPAAGVNDLHLHPALPRTVRVNLLVGF